MKRKNVYIGMAVISIITALVFIFLFMNRVSIVPTGLNKVINPNGAPEWRMNIYGDFSNNMDKPMDITVANSFIYVSDTNNKRVIAFDLAGSPIFTFGEEGNRPGQFKFPYGITADNDGQVYVADLYNGKISIHDEKGKFIKYFAEEYSKNKTISSPAGLRILNDKVYVTDVKANKVFVFDMAGKLLLQFGDSGKGDGKFIAPNAVTADKEGNIYVVDTGNSRLQVFDKDGKFVRIINGSKNGTGSSAFVNPRGVGIDARGFIYVVSNLTHFVHAFNKEGEQVFQFGGMGQENGKLHLPNGLFIDDSDNVFITDTLNLRVSVFR